MLKNLAHSRFLWRDGCPSLPFMWLINTVSGMSAIPQPRSNTVTFSLVTGRNLDSLRKVHCEAEAQLWGRRAKGESEQNVLLTMKGATVQAKVEKALR